MNISSWHREAKNQSNVINGCAARLQQQPGSSRACSHVLSQHCAHYNCSRQSCFNLDEMFFYMEAVNRWKCCTVPNCSLGCVCVCVCVCIYACVHVCASVCHLACRSTCFSYHLMRGMSLLKHHLFIWQSLLFVTSNMRSGASGDALRPLAQLGAQNITDQWQFWKWQAEEAEICDLTMWCNYSSFYPRELLCHLINTDSYWGVWIYRTLFCYLADEEWSDLSGEVRVRPGVEINCRMKR